MGSEDTPGGDDAGNDPRGGAGDGESAAEPDALPGVCVVTHPLSSAGENATRTLLNVLAAVTTVSLVTADLPEGSSIRDDHPVFEVSERGAGQSNVLVAASRFLRNQIRMAARIRERDEEVVLFFGATSYVLPLLFAKAVGKTVVVEPRGDVPLTLRLNWERRMPAPLARALAGLVRALEEVCYRAADGIVTYTPSMAAELGLTRFGGKLYPDGARYVDTDAFDVRVPYESRGEVVGFVGRLDEEKNVRSLLAAAQRLPESAEFRFVGDGPLRGELEAAATDDRVSFAGWVDHGEVPEELNRMRLLVLPSDPTEGLPTTILESLACGTPVYATPVSGVPDVVREGETGFLMDDPSPEAIAADVSAILDRDDLAEVSRRGREEVVSEYDFAAAARRYRDILSSLS
ncbi:glycosyltransferase family 4 protein [Halobaculum sp. EA56]|uniref:glycosyltransferase family 4 protein n=1 Tax=Halobaculum sp. EA56 TaxID=3421648 RepID=UPI003EB6C8B0